jgi:hypothetical protein
MQLNGCGCCDSRVWWRTLLGNPEEDEQLYQGVSRVVLRPHLLLCLEVGQYSQQHLSYHLRN